MNLSEYFEIDDGSLPEIEVAFPDPAVVPLAFKHLYECGARDASINGTPIWIKASRTEKPFSGPEDASLVVSGIAEAFHVVLGGITGSDDRIPDLGVFVFTDGLVLDYRMGPDWGQREVESLLALLRRLGRMGGRITVPWWGAAGERDFLTALHGV